MEIFLILRNLYLAYLIFMGKSVFGGFFCLFRFGFVFMDSFSPKVNRKECHIDYVPKLRFNNTPTPENAHREYNSGIFIYCIFELILRVQ